jgi:hypothetical protein
MIKSGLTPFPAMDDARFIYDKLLEMYRGHPNLCCVLWMYSIHLTPKIAYRRRETSRSHVIGAWLGELSTSIVAY